MTDLLDEVCAWIRGGAYVSDEARLTDAVMADDARLLAEAFTGEDGRKRLMVFARMSVLRPPVDHTLPPGAREAYAQLRQGQDSMFAGLVRYLDLHAENQRRPASDRHEHRDHPSHGGAEGFDGDERFGAGADYDPAGLVGGR